MIITISREFGSGGRELGKRLADELSIPCYDNEIIHYVSEHGGFDASFVANSGEKSITSFYTGTIAHRFSSPADNNVKLKIDLASAQREILIGFAEAGDCVIVGRAADVILSDYHPFNIFVHASKEARIERTLSRSADGEKLSKKDVERKMKEIDRQRARHRADFTNTKWGDMKNYHLCINTTGTEIKNLIPGLASYIRAWFGEDGGIHDAF